MQHGGYNAATRRQNQQSHRNQQKPQLSKTNDDSKS